ncbi:MAG: molybdopterin cofactor-binding domain-containing protein [Saprospiraceae bacterium]
MTSRRQFLKTASAAGAFLAIGFGNAASLLAAPLRKILPEEFAGEAGEIELNNFILITPDNQITIFNPRPEMGQGTWQSMPALIAEELEVTLDMVDIRITSGAKRHGRQGVGGSGSVRQSWEPLRKVGAAAKEMLTKAAANRWGVAETECFAEGKKIHHRPSGKSLTYGELAADAAKLDVPAEPKLKDPKDFRILGKPQPRPDVPSKVNGSAVFGIDVKVPGMLYASVQHCPVIHGKVLKFNEEAIRQMPGVRHVIKTERKMPHKAVEAVAVVADTYWAAVKARRALEIEWDNAGYEQISTDDYFAKTHAKALSDDGVAYPDAVGDVKTALAGAAQVIESQYETPFASHAQIEPVNATAWVQGDRAEVWAAVQSSAGTVGDVSKYLGIPAENVKVNVLFMGGSFGRKGYLDFVLEACHISKTVGAPVKLIWSREDDMSNGPYRPGMVSAMRGGLDKSGNLVAFEHKVCGASIGHQCFGDDLNGKPDGWSDDAISQETSPYAIPNRRQAHVHQPTDIPIVWWRSVYASTNSFGHECFVDELAHAAGRDPLDFRLDLLKNEPRWVALLQKLEEVSNYRKEKSAGKSVGVAVANSFGSTAAYAITVSKRGAGVKIEKVVCVIDCGMTVNPDTVRAQTEGNAIMALSAAIKPGITFAAGEAQESNFHQYPILTLRETPPIEVHIMPSTEKPGGVGEPGLPPFTPALFNAVFLATGKRVKRLPVDLENLG